MTSDELKLVFSSNLIRLRQTAGLTQLALAEKINYSDKTVSKWERGEAIPDAFVLKQLAGLFGVTVDSLLTENGGYEARRQQKVSYNPNYVILTTIAGICTLCLLEFVIVWMVVDQLHWSVLFAAVPLSLIAALIMNSIWYQGKRNVIIIGALVASLFLLAHLIAFQFKYNLWQILLVIVPAELIVVLANKIHDKGTKMRRKRR